jgi:hypothetical protein
MNKPNVGDRVWFYFVHSFSDGDGGKTVDERGNVVPMGRFNGRMEMRCRPARVVNIDAGPDQFDSIGMQWEALNPGMWTWLTLDIEFQDDDRHVVPGGLVYRMERRMSGVRSNRMNCHDGPHLGPFEAWPEDGTWSWQEKHLD